MTYLTIVRRDRPDVLAAFRCTVEVDPPLMDRQHVARWLL
jgi:hypothetical protein